jgi:transposase
MSKRKVYLAIDAHARHCTLGSMDGRGKFQRSWTFKTSEKELIRHVGGFNGQYNILAIEEGPLTYWIAQTIKPYVNDIIIADPRENVLISRNARKNDKLDVRNLCRLLRLGELKRVYHPENDERAVFKAAVQQYIDFRNQETAVKLKLKAKYRSWGVPEVEGTGVYNPKNKEHYLKGIKHVAVRNQLNRMYDLLESILKMQQLTLDEAKMLGRKYSEIKEFIKLPGIGYIGALIFDAYIQTPYRFARQQKLWKYCQLAVTDRRSDNKPLGYQRLDKAGNNELKAVSYRAFQSAMRTRRNNEVKVYYERSVRNIHNATHARLNTQRKILSVMYGVWRKGEVYRPELFLGSD